MLTQQKQLLHKHVITLHYDEGRNIDNYYQSLTLA